MKFNDQLERKQAGQSGFLDLPSRDMKTKTKIKQQKYKNNRKIKCNKIIKATGNITPTMDHYPKNGQMEDIDP